jgi:hypothetical protein
MQSVETLVSKTIQQKVMQYRHHLASEKIRSLKAQDGFGPRHPSWTDYALAKKEASVALTAAKILKLKAGGPMGKPAFRKALRDPETREALSSHATKKEASRRDTLNSFLFEAFNLSRSPSDGDLQAKAEEYAKERAMEAASRRKP